MFQKSLCLLMFGSATILLAQPAKKDSAPPGYKKENLHGFSLLVADDVYEMDKKSKLKRTPLECLERELQQIMKVVPGPKLADLKKVSIWVEWDEDLRMSNGRSGSALAVFSGGPQVSYANLGKGKPSRENAVTMLSLKNLASHHQPDRDGDCVTLHELAHAYHHLTLNRTGKEDPFIQNVYKQAMERKLYNPKLYAATNEYEYFAELTCAYLDRLDYVPRNREELKKHDPKGSK